MRWCIQKAKSFFYRCQSHILGSGPANLFWYRRGGSRASKSVLVHTKGEVAFLEKGKADSGCDQKSFGDTGAVGPELTNLCGAYERQSHFFEGGKSRFWGQGQQTCDGTGAVAPETAHLFWCIQRAKSLLWRKEKQILGTDSKPVLVQVW